MKNEISKWTNLLGSELQVFEQTRGNSDQKQIANMWIDGQKRKKAVGKKERTNIQRKEISYKKERTDIQITKSRDRNAKKERQIKINV